VWLGLKLLGVVTVVPSPKSHETLVIFAEGTTTGGVPNVADTTHVDAEARCTPVEQFTVTTGIAVETVTLTDPEPEAAVAPAPPVTVTFDVIVPATG